MPFMPTVGCEEMSGSRAELAAEAAEEGQRA